MSRNAEKDSRSDLESVFVYNPPRKFINNQSESIANSMSINRDPSDQLRLGELQDSLKRLEELQEVRQDSNDFITDIDLIYALSTCALCRSLLVLIYNPLCFTSIRFIQLQIL